VAVSTTADTAAWRGLLSGGFGGFPVRSDELSRWRSPTTKFYIVSTADLVPYGLTPILTFCKTVLIIILIFIYLVVQAL